MTLTRLTTTNAPIASTTVTTSPSLSSTFSLLASLSRPFPLNQPSSSFSCFFSSCFLLPDVIADDLFSQT